MTNLQKLAKYVKKYPNASYSDFIKATHAQDVTVQAFNVRRRIALTGSADTALTLEDMELIGEFVETFAPKNGFIAFQKAHPECSHISAHQFFRVKQLTLEAASDAAKNPMPELWDIVKSASPHNGRRKSKG